MKTATAVATIDRWSPKKDKIDPNKKVCAVSIRVTYDRKRRYFRTGINMTALSFKNLMTAKRRSESDKVTYNKIQDFVAKANGAIEKLPVFTFDNFKKVYIKNRAAGDSISVAFSEYVSDLRKKGRVGTASSYECAQRSFDKYKKDLRFADITPELLYDYESWMLGQGNALATVGIYVRPLRIVYKKRDIDKSLYPFGINGYQIPNGRNFKKAIDISVVERIFNYSPPKGSSAEMARDYWLFIYLCNGLNVKDLCLLQRKNIDGDFLRFTRAKTILTKKDRTIISVHLKPQTKAIIEKWGQRSISPDSYLFPHLTHGLPPERVRLVIQLLIAKINKYTKKMAVELGLDVSLTSSYARHTFGTVLKQKLAPTSFIKDSYGHDSEKTTENYLGKHNDDMLIEITNGLIDFPKTAN